MPDEEKKQKTPKGLEIPVPTKREVEDALAKMANAPQPSAPIRRPKK